MRPKMLLLACAASLLHAAIASSVVVPLVLTDRSSSSCRDSVYLTSLNRDVATISGPIRAADANGTTVGTATLQVDSPAPGFLTIQMQAAQSFGWAPGSTVSWDVFTLARYMGAVMSPQNEVLCHEPSSMAYSYTTTGEDALAFALTLSYDQLGVSGDCMKTSLFPSVKINMAGMDYWLAWSYVNPTTGEGSASCFDSPTAWGIGSFALRSCPCAPPPPPPGPTGTPPAPPSPPPPPPLACGDQASLIHGGVQVPSILGPIRTTTTDANIGNASLIPAIGSLTIVMDADDLWPAGTVVHWNVFDFPTWVSTLSLPSSRCGTPQGVDNKITVSAATRSISITVPYDTLILPQCLKRAFYPVVHLQLPFGREDAWLAWNWAPAQTNDTECDSAPTSWGYGDIILYNCQCEGGAASPPPPPPSPPPSCRDDGISFSRGKTVVASVVGPIKTTTTGADIGTATLLPDTPAPGSLTLILDADDGWSAGTVFAWKVYDFPTWVTILHGSGCAAPNISDSSITISANTRSISIVVPYSDLVLPLCVKRAFYPVVHVQPPLGRQDSWLAWNYIPALDPRNTVCANSPTSWGFGDIVLYNCPCGHDSPPPPPAPASPPPYACSSAVYLSRDGPGAVPSISGPIKASATGADVGSATLFPERPARGSLTLLINSSSEWPAGTVFNWRIFDFPGWVSTMMLPGGSGFCGGAPVGVDNVITIPEATSSVSVTVPYRALGLPQCIKRSFYPVVHVQPPGGDNAWLAWNYVAAGDPASSCPNSPSSFGYGDFSLYACICTGRAMFSPPPAPPAIAPRSMFPFGACSKRKANLSPYRMAAPTGPFNTTVRTSPTEPGLATYCFTVAATAVAATGSPCANMDINSIKFLVRTACVEESPKAVRKISVNGVLVWASYSTKIDQGVKYGIMAISGLTKSFPKVPAEGFRVCMAMDVESACSTPSQLCEGNGCMHTFYNAKQQCCPTSVVAASA